MRTNKIPPLFTHQVKDVKFCLDNPLVLDTSDPGCGKTRVQVEAFAIRRKKGGGKALILCPKSLTRTAWENDFNKFAPQIKVSVATAAKREEAFARDADVYVTNVDATIWLATKKPGFFKGFDTLIMDECFPAGTPVDTPKGAVNIEMLKVGDLVYTSSGALPITTTFVKEATNLVRLELDDGTTIDCTEDHPFATEKGWRPARETSGLQVVRLDFYEQSQPRTNILREIVLKKSDALKHVAGRQEKNGAEKFNQPCRTARVEFRGAMPPGDETKNKPRSQTFWAFAKSTWRKWNPLPTRTDGARNATKNLDSAVPYKDGNEERQRGTACLQGRLRESKANASFRDRREFARIAKTLRCKERHIAALSRVVSVSDIKSFGPTNVYNIQVDGPHDYSVRNTLVHNCTVFKHFTSKRSRAAAKISKFFDRRYGLTGTPNSNTIADIWHPVFLIDGGRRLGRSFYQFRMSVCAPKQVGPQPNMVKWEDKPGAESAVGALLQDMLIRNVFEECHDIPPNTLNTMPFYMTPKQAKVYQQMEKNAIALVNNNQIVSAVNAAVVGNKLLQIASGAVYGDNDPDGDHTYADIDTTRYELVCDLVDARTHPCVVFFTWKHQKDGLIKELERRKVPYTLIDGTVSDKNRALNVQHLQAGFYKVILCHPRSAAHGLTLTKATTTIWPSPVYDLEWFTQGNRRIYRAGQTQRTETIVLLAEGTIETTVYEKLIAKEQRQFDMLSVIKSMADK